MSGSSFVPKLVIVVVAMLALATAIGGSASASSEQAPSGRIIFARGVHLYVTAPDGREVTSLTRDATQPAVSRDGQRIAFVRGKSIWVMRRDGSGQTRLTSGHEDWTPTWSPDGSTIYFSRLVEGKDEYGGYEFAWPLFRMQSDGSGLRQVTRPQRSDHGVCDESPSASPDGRVIAYASFGECDRGNEPGISASIPRAGPFNSRSTTTYLPASTPPGHPSGNGSPSRPRVTTDRPLGLPSPRLARGRDVSTDAPPRTLHGRRTARGSHSCAATVAEPSGWFGPTGRG